MFWMEFAWNYFVDEGNFASMQSKCESMGMGHLMSYINTMVIVRIWTYFESRLSSDIQTIGYDSLNYELKY